jgi:hypothetical protein
LAERAPEKREVAGSTPAPATEISIDIEAERSARLVDPIAKAPDLGRAKATVTAKRPDGGDLPRTSPARHCLRIDVEHRGHF